jgi:hypothetical protein
MTCLNHIYMVLSDYPRLDVLVCIQRRRTATWLQELVLRSAIGHFRSPARKFRTICRHMSLPPPTSAFSVPASRHFCFLSPTPDLMRSSPAFCKLYSVRRLHYISFLLLFCLLSLCVCPSVHRTTHVKSLEIKINKRLVADTHICYKNMSFTKPFLQCSSYACLLI